jgi:hypothetical protein
MTRRSPGKLFSYRCLNLVRQFLVERLERELGYGQIKT